MALEKLSTIQKAQALIKLQQLAEHGPQKEGMGFSHGICGNLYDTIRGSSSFVVAELAEGWPYHSGSGAFPIKGTNGEGPTRAYHTHERNLTLWKGEQGEARRELCKYMADKLATILEAK